MQMPRLIYGTAWKEDRTADLVVQAITAGFRGIDTAAQPKHYHEKGVGEALKKLGKQGILREDIFIQTKFTPISGQDPSRIPYDPHAPLAQQVAQSFSSSLKNLGVDFIDSLVLHSPLRKWSDLLEVWTAMETLCAQVDRGGVKRLGISNCYDLSILKSLYAQAKIKPTVLQNRFYSESGYDTDLRLWCKEHGIIYQSFWSLTANPHILNSESMRRIAREHHKTEAQVFFRYLTQIGVVPLIGTQSASHMREDLEIFEFDLTEMEVETLRSLLEAV